jgi:hypothetical protein
MESPGCTLVILAVSAALLVPALVLPALWML